MPDLALDLRRPEAYPHAPDTVEHLQTHISWLFFAGSRVYKVKKPVDLGFLDYSTAEAREHFCEEEVRLNRRLAPDVYLGVVPITRSADGVHAIAGEGEVVDHAVEMRRLPAERMLEARLEEGAVDNGAMNALAELLVRFHAEADTGPGVDDHGAPDAVAALARENFEELEPYLTGRDAEGELAPITPTAFAFLRAHQSRWLEEHRELLERRVVEGRVRDGHGDLHASNICLAEEGVVVYDCIEFSPRFRCADVAADLAFLTMDLDDRGYPAFSAYLSHRYSELAGDAELPALERFYKGYRAVVRGKVAAITASQAEAGSERRDAKLREAARYLQLATAYELRPALVLLCGLPASGKSWFGRRLARPLRAAVLRSDVRRRTPEAAPPPDAEGGPEGYGTGRYSPEQKARTYDALLGAALEEIDGGRTAIVDATFSSADWRAPFAAAAAERGLPLLLVRVSVSEEVTRERLERRAHDAHEASEADLSVYLRARETFEPPDELPPAQRIELPGEGGVEERVQAVLDALVAQED